MSEVQVPLRGTHELTVHAPASSPVLHDGLPRFPERVQVPV